MLLTKQMLLQNIYLAELFHIRTSTQPRQENFSTVLFLKNAQYTGIFRVFAEISQVSPDDILFYLFLSSAFPGENQLPSPRKTPR
jgi:hypothetical protein